MHSSFTWCEQDIWKIRLQLTKPVTWPPLVWGVLCGAAASGMLWCPSIIVFYMFLHFIKTILQVQYSSIFNLIMKYIPTSIVSDKQLNPVGPSFFLNHPLTLVQGQSNLAGALLELSLGQVQSSG